MGTEYARLAIVNERGEVLLQKHIDQVFILPGGAREETDRSILHTLMRELSEETLAEQSVLDSLEEALKDTTPIIVGWKHEKEQNKDHTFFTKWKEDYESLFWVNPNDKDIIDVVWYSLGDIRNGEIAGQIYLNIEKDCDLVYKLILWDAFL